MGSSDKDMKRSMLGFLMPEDLNFADFESSSNKMETFISKITQWDPVASILTVSFLIVFVIKQQLCAWNI